MRVKSLTPPLPSVLPITATTSSAPNTPALMHAAMPEASITLFNSTLVTTMAMGSRSLERVSMLKTGHDVNGALRHEAHALAHPADQPQHVGDDHGHPRCSHPRDRGTGRDDSAGYRPVRRPIHRKPCRGCHCRSCRARCSGGTCLGL